MITPEMNEMLCRVGAGTPMGEMMREYWHPILRSERLAADGDPVRVRLLGGDYIAFRTTDGQVGFLNERCPHRCASLALGRNEGNGLRCIFHGWKFDARGKVVEIPTEQPERVASFAAHVTVHHYPVREAGGIVWVFLNEHRAPPPFPDLEFTHLPADQVLVRIAVTHCNWLQAFEGVLDSSHLGILHSTSGMERIAALDKVSRPARFEVITTPYGVREAAIREGQDSRHNIRIREVVAPYGSLPPGPVAEGNYVAGFCVPIDDEWTTQIWVTYNIRRPLRDGDMDFFWQHVSSNRDDFRGPPGDVNNLWGQDRDAMRNGHWSGFTQRPLLLEDFAVQESMGPITDRTQEYLGSSDVVIMRARRQLIASLEALKAGMRPWGLGEDGIDYQKIRATQLTLRPDEDWRKIDAFEVTAKAVGA